MLGIAELFAEAGLADWNKLRGQRRELGDGSAIVGDGESHDGRLEPLLFGEKFGEQRQVFAGGQHGQRRAPGSGAFDVFKQEAMKPGKIPLMAFWLLNYSSAF